MTPEQCERGVYLDAYGVGEGCLVELPYGHARGSSATCWSSGGWWRRPSLWVR